MPFLNLTLAMGYGLLFATFITLGLLPCMYSIGADIKVLLLKVRMSFYKKKNN